MSTLALQRLAEERKNFRKSRPFGYSAKPVTRPDGSVNLLEWKCIVPGKEKTACEGGKFPCTIIFGANYPAKPPAVYMPKGFFHVNICPNSGAVCLSVLKILISLQELLCNPNFGSVLGRDAYEVKNKYGMAEYEKRTRHQTAKYSGNDDDE